MNLDEGNDPSPALDVLLKEKRGNDLGRFLQKTR